MVVVICQSEQEGLEWTPESGYGLGLGIHFCVFLMQKTYFTFITFSFQ